ATAPAGGLRDARPAGGVDRRVERSPARLQDRREALELGVVDRACVRLRCDRRGTEVGGGVALPTFGDAERGCVLRRLEPEPRAPQDIRVAASRVVEALEGGRLRPPRRRTPR